MKTEHKGVRRTRPTTNLILLKVSKGRDDTMTTFSYLTSRSLNYSKTIHHHFIFKKSGHFFVFKEQKCETTPEETKYE